MDAHAFAHPSDGPFNGIAIASEWGSGRGRARRLERKRPTLVSSLIPSPSTTPHCALSCPSLRVRPISDLCMVDGILSNISPDQLARTLLHSLAHVLTQTHALTHAHTEHSLTHSQPTTRSRSWSLSPSASPPSQISRAPLSATVSRRPSPTPSMVLLFVAH